MPSYKGECFCGAVQIREAGGERLLPLPILPFLVSRARQCLHALEARTAGAEHIATFPKTACSQRQYCKNCGGHLMTNHPLMGLIDVYPATLPTLQYQPSVHINYAETVLPMRDGLPKLKDFPAEFGGSGEEIAE